MKPIHVTIGIILGIATIILANSVVTEAYANVLRVEPYLLEIILGIFFLSFVAALLMGMRYSNFMARLLYILTSFYFGFFVYIFLAAVVYLILLIIFGPIYSIVGVLLVFIPILFGVWGILNAEKISIKTIPIKLANLPEKWNNKKAVWISDVHIGLVYRAKYVRKITKMINELKPDIVFIGGDLYDGISTKEVLDYADPLRDIVAPDGIYFVTGNHEKYGNIIEFHKKIESLGIKILNNKLTVIDGMQIIGIEYSKETKGAGLQSTLSNLNINKNIPSILLKHEPREVGIAEKAGISMQISGHTHNAQQWPLNYYAKLIYKEFTYGLKHKGDMIVYTSSGVGTWGPKIRIGSKCEIVEFIFNS